MYSPFKEEPYEAIDPKIGTVGVMSVNGLEFEVRVLATRRRYGHTDYKITPVRGSGNRWAEQSSIRFD